jgi:hypothetical protein
MASPKIWLIRVQHFFAALFESRASIGAWSDAQSVRVKSSSGLIPERSEHVFAEVSANFIEGGRRKSLSLFRLEPTLAADRKVRVFAASIAA